MKHHVECECAVLHRFVLCTWYVENV